MQQVIVNKQGCNARILKWRNPHDIDIIFDDGVVIKNRNYSDFKNGKFKHPYKGSANIDDLKGQKFGKLTVIRDSGKRDKNNAVIWECKCDCGNPNLILVRGRSLKTGNTKSCGCFKISQTTKLLSLNEQGVINRIIDGYRRNAKSRNLSWELSNEEVKETICKPCFYCGDKDSNLRFTRGCKEGYRYNGIDRIDSKIGYISSNIVPCCKTCNRAKSDMTQKEFYEWVQRINKNFTYDKVL